MTNDQSRSPSLSLALNKLEILTHNEIMSNVEYSSCSKHQLVPSPYTNWSHVPPYITVMNQNLTGEREKLFSSHPSDVWRLPVATHASHCGRRELVTTNSLSGSFPWLMHNRRKPKIVSLIFTYIKQTMLRVIINHLWVTAPGKAYTGLCTMVYVILNGRIEQGRVSSNTKI